MADQKYVTVIRRRSMQSDEPRKCEARLTATMVVALWNQNVVLRFHRKDGREIGVKHRYLTDPYYELGPNWRQEIGHE